MRLSASAGRCGSVEKVWDSGHGWLGHPKGKNSMAAYKSNSALFVRGHKYVESKHREAPVNASIKMDRLYMYSVYEE